MVLLNRLNNGVGKDSDFALYLPKGVDILMKSSEFCLKDEEIPEKIRQGNLKLLYRPNIYTIRRDKESGKIILTDISTQEAELPTCLAAYKPEKSCPEILFHGFMLCADKNLGKLSPEDQKEYAKISSHFERLIQNDMRESARHELKHIENAIYFNELHKQGGALNHEYFIRKCFLDEISATIQENIEQKVHTQEEGLAYAKNTFREWINNPRRESYYGEFGCFEHHYGAYEEKTRDLDTSASAQMYQQILHKFFTFKINGLETDLSAAIDPDFALPQQSQNNIIKMNRLADKNNGR